MEFRPPWAAEAGSWQDVFSFARPWSNIIRKAVSGIASADADEGTEERDSSEEKCRREQRRLSASSRSGGNALVEVHIYTLGGTEHVVNAQRQWSVGSLKKALEITAGIAVKEQRLVQGTTVLLDENQLLEALIAGASTTGVAASAPERVQGSEARAVFCRPDSNSDVDREELQGTRLELTLVRRTVQQAMWLQRLGRFGVMLYDAPPELKADRELVLTAIRQDEEAFQYADATLQADRSFVLVAVQLNAAVLPYVSSAFRSDREIVLAAVSRHGEVLHCVGSEFRTDREVVLNAVKQHGLALRYACESLRGDRDVAIAAAEQHAGSVAYVAEALRSDQEVLLAALRSKVDPLAEKAHSMEHRLIDEVDYYDPCNHGWMDF